MAREPMTLRFQPRQAFRKPDDTLTDRAQLAGLLKTTVSREICPPQAVNHPLDPLYGADNHAGKEQYQPKADEEQHQRLPAEELAALGNLLLSCWPPEKITVRVDCTISVLAFAKASVGRRRRHQDRCFLHWSCARSFRS